MKTTSSFEDETTPAVKVLPLTYAHGDVAYGISVLPWHDKIRLDPATPGKSTSPRFKGSIAFSNGVAPIFDLRDPSVYSANSSPTQSCLLVISMFNNTSGPMLIGLLIQMGDNGFSFPAALLNNLGGGKDILSGSALN